MTKLFKLLALVLVLGCISCASAKVKYYKPIVIQEFSHDTSSYTQGLFFDKGVLYESNGLYGHSTFKSLDLKTGKSQTRLIFSKDYFVEGSVVLNNKLYILTWQSKKAFIYSADSLKYEKTYDYPREGWGLTTNGRELIASDGSSNIYFLDTCYNVLRRVDVLSDGRPLRLLNELEYINGKIWANVYMTDLIAIIDPKSGNVEGFINCSGLLKESEKDENTDVLNGIAYNPTDNKIYITGKRWPKIFEITLSSVKK